ncbi:MAG: nicotinate (nicotinamide) nucleotide adenylyltransferase [Rhabdochlamydiaceae bacterium]|nr:nicotinate (nicotinamide) nucleotide adenylyltransferase [Candidatus Amphrikana amoebophyrae]
MKKIGFFGGSFNPIHNGHLNLAVSVLEQLKLDQILLCPNNISPFEKITIEARHRYEMVQLACLHYDHIDVTDIEINRGGMSYTIDTLRELSKVHPDCVIRFIIADELIPDFPRWKEQEAIISEYSPILATRHGTSHPNLPGFEQVKTPIMQISSTEVRDRIKEGFICEHLLPHAVLTYMEKHNLYK